MDRPASAGNPRFFASTGPHLLAAVAQAADCAIPPGENAPASGLLLTGLAALETAGPSEISFAVHRRHAAALAATCAGAVLVRPDGHVVWAAPGATDLRDVLARWFGPARAL